MQGFLSYYRWQTTVKNRKKEGVLPHMAGVSQALMHFVKQRSAIIAMKALQYTGISD